jgi:hypothetical protein
VEPIEEVLGVWVEVELEVAHRVPTIGQKGMLLLLSRRKVYKLSG